MKSSNNFRVRIQWIDHKLHVVIDKKTKKAGVCIPISKLNAHHLIKGGATTIKPVWGIKR